MKMSRPLFAVFVSAALLTGCGNDRGPAPVATPTPTAQKPTRTIIFVWDGLRPDDVSQTDTPNLYALQQAGVSFQDNHSTYPTFTMMNGSSFATGSFPKTSGFYSNTFWTPPQGSSNTIPAGNTASGTAQDYVDPVFTEDYQVLNTLNTYYGGQLLLVKSLFATAQAAGMTTATIGKSGAAYIQDLGEGGLFLDEIRSSRAASLPNCRPRASRSPRIQSTAIRARMPSPCPQPTAARRRAPATSRSTRLRTTRPER